MDIGGYKWGCNLFSVISDEMKRIGNITSLWRLLIMIMDSVWVREKIVNKEASNRSIFSPMICVESWE
jgi:hypothetical protein